VIKSHQKFELYNKLLLEKVVIVPPVRVPGIMPNEACFLYAVRGSSELRSPAEVMTLQPREGVVLKCGNYLNEWLETNQPDTCEAIAIHFYPEVLRRVYEKELPVFLNEIEKSVPAPIQKVKADQLVQNYINSLQFYFENPALVSDELLKLKLKELILLLAKTDNALAIRQMISSLFTPSEYSFKDVIESNIYSNLTNEELAILTNQSISSFKREFDKVYRTSPAKYFRNRKLERAAELLFHTSQRISDIAFSSGYVDVAHFSRSFQKKYDLSPTEFRMNQTSK
jgi:AraC-like DNA-binding protein